MGASSSIATAIQHWRTKSENGMAIIRNFPEAVTQTFQPGVPLYLVSGGLTVLSAGPTSTPAGNIAGISTVPGANLTTLGTAKTQNLIQKPPNQANAVITPLGAPPNDGTSQILTLDGAQTFVATLGDSSNNANATLALALVGGTYGIFLDPGNAYWYVDNHVTTVAGGACCVIAGLIDAVGTLNGRVEIRFTSAVNQL